MSKWVKIAGAVVVGLVIVGLLAASALDHELRRALPTLDGTLVVPGLDAEVHVYRDEWGVPHIYASTMHDLFMAQGFVHAQDRFWQMEWWRHIVQGRLAEITGEELVETDMFLRTLGIRRIAEQEVELLDDFTASALEAYADGINAYISSRSPADLALNFEVMALTGHTWEIEPWEPADTLTWAKLISWYLSGNMDNEMARMIMLRELGEEMTEDYFPGDYELFPLIVPNLDELYSRVDVRLVGGVSPSADLGLGFEPGEGIGSNNWVVAPARSESGAPFLANDPHLGVMMPSIWYTNGLHCSPVTDDCPMEVIGYTFPGSPGVIVGHNRRIAWGVTNAFPDVQDLYIETLNPDNPDQYLFDGEWVDMDIATETIHVFGGEPVEIEVRWTRHGPIVTDLNDEADEVLALRWTVLEPGNLLGAVIGIDMARNWDEFRQALELWDWPAQNFVYADVEGHIGYQMSGKVPIRVQGHNGLVPVPGTGEYEWQGYIPFEYLPSVLDPASGYVITANNTVVDPVEYQALLEEELGTGRVYLISGELHRGYRARRIEEMLTRLQTHDMASFRAMQGDNFNNVASEILPFLLELDFDDPLLEEAAQVLAEWDLRNDMDSTGAPIYEAFWMMLVRDVFADQMPDELDPPTGIFNNQMAVRLLMDEPDNPWWDDVGTPQIETRDDILRRAFGEGVEWLVDNYGGHPGEWSWGDMHTVTFVSDPLGRSGIPIIEAMFNAGPYPVGGGSAIVNNTVWDASSGSFAVRWLPSMRMMVSLEEPIVAYGVHTTGQSGHPYSEHYRDMITRWQNILYHPLLFYETEVLGSAEHHLVLAPESG